MYVLSGYNSRIRFARRRQRLDIKSRKRHGLFGNSAALVHKAIVNTSARAILLVEDNEDDVFLMRRAFKGAHIANPIYVVDNGQAAIAYLSGEGKYADRHAYPMPAIAFLDVNLPYKAGHDVLTWITRQKELESLIPQK